MKELILIKLGGSIITNKGKEYFAREENITRLAREIKLALNKTNIKIIVGHGAGSFAHTPAYKYKTKDGLITENSLFGMGVTEESARLLNQIVVKKFIGAKIPTYAFSPGSFLISDAKVYSKSYKFNEKHSCLKKLGIRKPYLLFVGVVQPRKNLVRLIEAFSKLVNDGGQSEAGSLDLVVAGKLGWMYEDVFNAVSKFDVKEKVKFLGFVEQADLPIVFQEACCYVQPSLTEGFGLPVLEAMASGTPVITSARSSLPEVAGDAAYFVNPMKSLHLTYHNLNNI